MTIGLPARGGAAALPITIGSFVLLRMLLFAYNGLLPPMLPEITHDLRVGLGLGLWAVALPPVMWSVAGVALGPVAEHHGHKNLLVLGTLCMGLSFIVAAMTSNYSAFLILRILGGIAGGATGPTSQAALVHLLPPERLKRGFGWVSAGYQLGGVVLVPLGLFLAGVAGWRFCLIAFGAVHFIIAALLAWTVPSSPPAGSTSERAYSSRLVGAVMGGNNSRAALLSNLWEHSAASSVATFFPLTLREFYGFSLITFAPVNVVVSLFGAVGALMGGYSDRVVTRWNERSLYAAAILISAPLGIGALVTTQSVYLAIACACGYAVVDNVARPVYLNHLGRTTTQPSVIMGWNGVTNQLGSGVGSAVPAALLGHLGYPGVGLCTAAFAALASSFVRAWTKAPGPKTIP